MPPRRNTPVFSHENFQTDRYDVAARNGIQILKMFSLNAGGYFRFVKGIWLPHNKQIPIVTCATIYRGITFRPKHFLEIMAMMIRGLLHPKSPIFFLHFSFAKFSC